MTSALYLILLSTRDAKFIQLHPEEIKKPEDMESYAIAMISLIETR